MNKADLLTVEQRASFYEQAYRDEVRKKNEAVNEYATELREVVNALRKCARHGATDHTFHVLHKYCSE